MSTYNIQFTRYSADRGRVITAPGRFEAQATSFAEAFAEADSMLQGMRAADPAGKYQIATIECTSYTVLPLDGTSRYSDPFALTEELDQE